MQYRSLPCAVLLAFVVLSVPLSGPALAKGAGKPASAAPAAKTPSRVSFDILPTPAWVVPAKENPAARLEASPMHFRMIDDQTKVDAKERVQYSHVVRVVDSTAGLETAAHLEMSFDPSYEKLVIHHVDIIRHGQRLNRLDPAKVQLLQRETQLERQMYDGRITASLILSDVRVGDEIDFATSVHGSNPVFKGRFADFQPLVAFRGPSAVYQYRVSPRPRARSPTASAPRTRRSPTRSATACESWCSAANPCPWRTSTRPRPTRP